MDSLSKLKYENRDRRLFRVANSFVRYFLRPLREGLYGFSFILAIIFFVKWISSPIDAGGTFMVDIIDIKLSLTGFFLLFVLCVLDNLNTKNNMVDNSLPT
jgi:hypothetical protein